MLDSLLISTKYSGVDNFFFVEIWIQALCLLQFKYIVTVEVYPVVFVPSQECRVAQSNLKPFSTQKWKFWWECLKICGTLFVKSFLSLRELPGKNIWSEEYSVTGDYAPQTQKKNGNILV